MSQFNLWPHIVLMLAAIVACKKPSVTNSPVKSASSSEASPVSVFKGEEVVDLDAVPQLSVFLNLKACFGPSRWGDFTSTSETRIGAVSVAPTTSTSTDSTQPDAKVFQPYNPVDAADSTSKATAQFFWRLNRAIYSIDVIAYSFKGAAKGLDTKTESNLKKEINLITGRETVLTVDAVWADGVCKLSWR